jgi:hypothetical protein
MACPREAVVANIAHAAPARSSHLAGVYKRECVDTNDVNYICELQWKWHQNEKSGMWRFVELLGHLQRHALAIGEPTLAECSGRTFYRRSLGDIGATSRLQRMPNWSGTRQLAGRHCWFHYQASKARQMCTLPDPCVGPMDKALSKAKTK